MTIYVADFLGSFFKKLLYFNFRCIGAILIGLQKFNSLDQQVYNPSCAA